MPGRKTSILVVDDDHGMRRLLRRSLELAGYDVVEAADGPTALDSARAKAPDLVLLDVMMPGMDGFEVCQQMRQNSSLPIVMVTARGQDMEKVTGLDLGADDYITKPFGIDELLARVKAVLRRSTLRDEMPQPPFEYDGLHLDFNQHQVIVEGKETNLTSTEYKLLVILVFGRGNVLTQDMLLSKVWGESYTVDAHVLHVNIARLRQKLGDDPANPRYILTKVGVGYCFKKP
ncbi:MAG: response regulator transcription factor [Dehalococcoidia bacterium]|nr:response regulator transcription factor [Dehalococcoidia bacterium]